MWELSNSVFLQSLQLLILCSYHCVQLLLARNKVRKTRVATNWEWKQTLRLSRHVPRIVTSFAPKAGIRVWYFLYLALLCSLVPLLPKWAINKRLIRGNGLRYSVCRSLRADSTRTIMFVHSENLRMRMKDDIKTAVTITTSLGCAALHIFIEILVQFCTVGMLHFINLS